MKRGTFGLGVVYLLFGLYLINYPLQIIKIPISFATVEPWVIFIGGVLVLLGAINHFRIKRYSY